MRMRYNGVMAETQSSNAAQEEIQKLEQQLEEKKRAFAQTGGEMPEEKELFREVLKDHITELRSSTPFVAPSAPPQPEVVLPSASANAPAPITGDTQADVQRREADEATVRMLVDKAMTGTVEDAVREAEKIGRPYIVDELHGHLIDKYDQLIALRKIKAL